MNIRNANLDDINDIVAIHVSAFPNFFLTSLGKRFLAFYYSCLIKSEETLTLCALDNDIVVGFAATAKVAKGFNCRLIKQNFADFVGLTFRLLFNNPQSLIRLAKNLSKKGNVADNEDYAELYSFGVKKSQQGKGTGKALLLHSEQILKRDGVERVSLTTDYYNNDNTVAFYHSMGYETYDEFITYPHRKMYRLIKTL